MKKINKIIVSIIILLLLFTIGLFLALAFANKLSFSVITYPQGKLNVNQDKLLKGEKITGEFRAAENNLGIILVSFKSYVKPDYSNEDILQFSIKEKAKSNIYYKGEYRSGLFEHVKSFPFGFTVIPDSKDKIYQFQIVSLEGNQNNAVEVEKKNVFFAGYQFPKNETIGNKEFLLKKLSSSFSDPEFFLRSLLYFLPFLLYLFYLIFLKKPLFVRKFFAYFFSVALLADILFIKDLYIGLLIGLAIAWIISVLVYKLKSKYSFFLFLGLVIFWLILLIFGISSFSDKLNFWVFAFFAIGVFHLVIEEKKILKK